MVSENLYIYKNFEDEFFINPEPLDKAFLKANSHQGLKLILETTLDDAATVDLDSSVFPEDFKEDLAEYAEGVKSRIKKLSEPRPPEPEVTGPEVIHLKGNMVIDMDDDNKLKVAQRSHYPVYDPNKLPTAKPSSTPPQVNYVDIPKTCLHDQCSKCNGKGSRADGTTCVHMISCPCARCTPSY